MGAKPVSGALLPSGINKEIEPVMVGEYTHIQSLVGGAFDVVRTKINGHVIVGYVHDEGLLIGLEQNWFASALFSRDLVGPCVIVGGESPSGEYDGEDYDLPENFYQFLTTKFTQHVADTYNEATTATIALELAQHFGIITEDEIDELMEAMSSELNGEGKTNARELLEDLTHKVNVRLQELAELSKDKQAEKMVNEIEEFLKENS